MSNDQDDGRRRSSQFNYFVIVVRFGFASRRRVRGFFSSICIQICHLAISIKPEKFQMCVLCIAKISNNFYQQKQSKNQIKQIRNFGDFYFFIYFHYLVFFLQTFGASQSATIFLHAHFTFFGCCSKNGNKNLCETIENHIDHYYFV